NVKLFLFRIEDVDDLVGEIEDFCGVAGIKIGGENKGSEKWYSGYYQEFKNKEVKNWYKEMMEETRTYKFFYE
ncbi:putative capsular polysaccharide synthesis family protein, partial [Staphylococcus aureus]|uniref:putative capsular polysaccharide synthesis family protein n=1 Tax=Staphylococcus aureus TaxID=1280 RepID=UPI00301C9214